MIEAALFDLDGTLIDSNDVWKDVDDAFLKAHSLKWDEAYGYAVSNMDYKGSATFVVQHYQLNATAEDVMREWEALALEAYKKEIPLKTGARELVEYFLEQGIKLALVTLSPEILYETILKRFGMSDHFHLKMSVPGGEFSQKTPALYQDICSQLQVQPSACVGFDDALPAVQAMSEIGIRAFAINDRRNQKERHNYVEAGFNLHNWSEVRDKMYKNI